jgi:hypothetical protein
VTGEHQASRSANDISIIDSLVSLPFSGQDTPPGKGDRWGGPSYHLAILWKSRGFWDDRSEDVIEAAEQEAEERHAAIAGILTGRWGAPETVELFPYLGFDHPDPNYVAPEPLLFLCGIAGTMQVWRSSGGDRWLGLAIGQADPEWPLWLVAAVGDSSSLAA